MGALVPEPALESKPWGHCRTWSCCWGSRERVLLPSLWGCCLLSSLQSVRGR